MPQHKQNAAPHPLPRRQTMTAMMLTAAIWLVYAFALYALMYMVREMFRVMNYAMTNELLALTGEAHYFFNFIFAAIACVATAGFMAGNFLKPVRPEARRLGHKKWWAVNEQTSLNWYFLHWFASLGTLLGLWLGIDSLFYHIDLYRDYKLMFIGIPIVLFLHTWLGRRAVLKKQGLKWMGLAALGITIVSFVFSRIDITNYRAMDEAMKKNIVAYNYTIRLPEATETLRLWGADRERQLYMGYHKVVGRPDSTPAIVLERGELLELTPDEVSEYVNSLYASHEDWPKYIVLHIDRHVKMKHVKALQYAVSRGRYRTVMYATAGGHPGEHVGLRYGLRASCEEWLKEAVDFIKAHNKLPEEITCPYPHLPVLYDNTTEKMLAVQLKKNSYLVSDTLVPPQDLYWKVYTALKKEGKNLLVELDVDDDSDYGHYIALIDLLTRAYNHRLDELAHARFGRTYPRDIYSYSDADYEIRAFLRATCIMQIVEWADNEKYIRKAMARLKAIEPAPDQFP